MSAADAANAADAAGSPWDSPIAAMLAQAQGLVQEEQFSQGISVIVKVCFPTLAGYS